MELGELLRELRAHGLNLHVEGQRAQVKGLGRLAPETAERLKGALLDHRPHLLRLHREPASRPPWREALDRADDDHREAWALLAHGYEAEGLPPRAAEFWAWETITSDPFEKGQP